MVGRSLRSLEHEWPARSLHHYHPSTLSLSPLGKLVIADTNRVILLRTKHILIGNKGELHIGSPDCPYKGNLTISLFGRYSWMKFSMKTVMGRTAMFFSRSDANQLINIGISHFNYSNQPIKCNLIFWIYIWPVIKNVFRQCGPSLIWSI